MSITVRPATPADDDPRASLRNKLWPFGSVLEHKRDVEIARKKAQEVCLVAVSDGVVVGFAELSLHNVVDSCESSPIGYLEGWYVEPQKKLGDRGDSNPPSAGSTNRWRDLFAFDHCPSTTIRTLISR